MDIDIRELEAFVSVVDHGSFSRAARELYLTQPTVSSHVADLERKLNLQLLIRASRTVYPSEAGKLLYGYAREMLQLRAKAVEAMTNYAREMSGTIHLAASPTPGRYYLPALLQSFQKKYPDIRFDLQLSSSKGVAAQVADRQVDMGFTGTVISLPSCLYQTLTEDHFVLITPDTPVYRTCLSTGLSHRQLQRESFICRESGSRARMEMDHFLHLAGLTTRDMSVAMEVSTTDALTELVSQGAGVALVPYQVYKLASRSCPILAFPYEEIHLRQKLYLVHHKNTVLSPIAQAFERYATAYFPPEIPMD